jgi:hypothetical protein
MKVTLVGLRVLDFEDDTGKPIQGIKLNIAYPDEGVYGNAVESRFINQTVFDGFGIELEKVIKKIGEVIDIEYSPKNKIVGMKL